MNRPYNQNTEGSSVKTMPILATLAHRKITRQYGLTKPHAKLIAELQGYGGVYE